MKRLLMAVMIIFCMADICYNYPVDGYQHSGIRRVERLRIRLADKLPGPVPVEGGRKSISDIRLQLFAAEGIKTLDMLNPPAWQKYPQPLPPGRLPASNSLLNDINLEDNRFLNPDSELQSRLTRLFGSRDPSYSLAMLEITPGAPFRYGAIKPFHHYSPGSIGKLAIAVGIFNELSRRFPNNIDSRHELLKNRLVTAREWIHTDSHGVPLYNLDSGASAYRPIKEGDVFTLYEWLDHMLSASSNAAASTVWKEVMLMRAFGHQYPPSLADEKAFFKTTPGDSLQRLAIAVVNQPLQKAGISENYWRLGSFFTGAGKKMVPGSGSTGTPAGLLLFLIRLEQGKLVDPWSSLEIKRLMYMTEKRIRYAASPRLNSAAVYFKSGSFYGCQPEPGFKCGKYMGNVRNFMNSVAIIERPDGKVYLVALMSNVLRKNSAVEHQSLATFIDQMIE